jgi:DNA-directed RNA polymerase subunit M/transcription elongation factor TFIIS
MHVVHINPPQHSESGQKADKQDKKAKKEQQPPVLFECPECGEKMVRVDLLRHRCVSEQTVTAPENRPFVCDTCNKAFKTVEYY